MVRICFMAPEHTMQDDTRPKGMIHIQLSFHEFELAFNKFWLVKTVFRYKVRWQQIHRTVKGCCSLAFCCAMFLLPQDHVSKNQHSTNQKLFNPHANLQNYHWICILLLDIYCIAEYAEEMSFENVDRRTKDGQWMPTYTKSSPMCLWLRWANKLPLSAKIAHLRPSMPAIKGM